MKYIISIFLCLISFTKIASAQVLFLNTSSVNDMEVTYRFCNNYPPGQYNVPTDGCRSSTASIMVKSRNNQAEKNYVKFDVFPEEIRLATNMVQIVSVVEKDPAGNILARADFATDNGPWHSSCKGEHIMVDWDSSAASKDANIGFIFSDNPDLPIIFCHTESF